MNDLTSLEQAVIELFPNAPITGNAHRKATAYINATIEVRGLVESFMFALRDPDDDALSGVYFPPQLVSKNGVCIDPREKLKAAEDTSQLGKRMAGIIHSHRYGALIPSEPYHRELNDRDHNRLILDEAGVGNCKTKNIQFTEKDIELALSHSGFTHRGPASQPISTRSHYNMKRCMYDLMRHYCESEENFKCFEAPVSFEYIYSIIMNPTIPQKISRLGPFWDYLNSPITLGIFSEKRRKKKFERCLFGFELDIARQMLAERHTTLYQEDIYKDPHVEVVFQPKSSVTRLPYTCNEMQLPLKIIEKGKFEEIDYEAIKQEVRQKTKRRPVQFIESLRSQFSRRNVFSHGGYI